MRTGVISRMCALSCYGPAAATQRHRMLEKRKCAPGLRCRASWFFENILGVHLGLSTPLEVALAFSYPNITDVTYLKS
jgi:hypothetical protein